jgi:hypothetical protein
MMQRYPAPPQLHGRRLAVEIKAAIGQSADVIHYAGDNEVGVATANDHDRAVVGSIVANHAGAVEADLRPGRALQKIEGAIGTLEQADANWASLTAAQKDAAARLVVRATAKLGRFLLGRFDVPE